MGDGVMVYTSAMYLRPGAVTGCVDYVQFGQDDFIPFITYRKSDKEPVQADSFTNYFSFKKIHQPCIQNSLTNYFSIEKMMIFFNSFSACNMATWTYAVV
jgi:hypothetical protein